jgi:hypothetical protein
MSYFNAKALADSAAQSAVIARTHYGGETEYGDRMMADAVEKLARAVATLAASLGQAAAPGL